MKFLVVRCPVCHKQKNELIDEVLLSLRKSIPKGTLLMKISANVVCEHSFYIELDMNYQIRNAFVMEG